ncbi:MAG: phenylalanine--tRNA ligase subunit beta [Acidobacteriota bacterium]
MRFSLAWLRDHLDSPLDADELARRLTAAGMNVEVRESAGDDEVWDVDVTTNRPDAMNHRGLAREAAAAGCGTLRPLAVSVVEEPVAVGDLARVTVEDATGCPRYCARVVRGVRIGPSPPALAARLERCGIRPINNVVDATNYVLLDVGQPLHAFDLSRLGGGEVVVRRARAGETMRTLDGEYRTLEPGDVVIADRFRAVGLAGVMGGADSEISPATRDVLLESASFDPLAIRRTARRLGMKTEASHRFERGTDREMARHAVDQVAALIAGTAGGEVAAGVLDSAPAPPPPATIAMSLARLDAFAGCAIPSDFTLAALAALGLQPERDGDVVTAKVPSWRSDLELVEDLYEEVLRLFGYDRIPAQLPVVATTPGARLGSWPLTERAREALVAVGAAEAFTYAFTAEDAEAATAITPLSQRGEAVRVANPLSARMAVMRRSLLAGLAEAAGGNLRRGAERVLIGEVGRVFFAAGSAVREEERLAFVEAGVVGPWDATRAVEFLDLKGLVEGALVSLGVDGVAWRPATTALLAPGEGAEAVRGGQVIAVAGRLAEAAAALVESTLPLWVAEIDLACVGELAVPAYRPLPRFPAVTADLTVRHPVSLPFDRLIAAIRAAAPPWLESVAPVVRYRGEGVASDEVKTTVRMVYRHPDRSLTQDEVNAAHFSLMDSLTRELGVSFS